MADLMADLTAALLECMMGSRRAQSWGIVWVVTTALRWVKLKVGLMAGTMAVPTAAQWVHLRVQLRVS